MPPHNASLPSPPPPPPPAASKARLHSMLWNAGRSATSFVVGLPLAPAAALCRGTFLQSTEAHIVVTLCTILYVAETAHTVWSVQQYVAQRRKTSRARQRQVTPKDTTPAAAPAPVPAPVVSKSSTDALPLVIDLPNQRTEQDEDYELSVSDDVESNESVEEGATKATAETLIHYWRQLERAVLTAPRVPPLVPLPPQLVSTMSASSASDTSPSEGSTTKKEEHFPFFSEDTSTLFTKETVTSKHRCKRKFDKYADLFVPPLQRCFYYDTPPVIEKLARWSVTLSIDVLLDPNVEKNALRTSTKETGERESALKWEGLFLVWVGSVDFSVTVREVRSLLLSAIPFEHPLAIHTLRMQEGPDYFDVASANLALLWYLTSIRAIYESLLLMQDARRCEDDIEELETYRALIYNKCIARWPSPEEMDVIARVALDSGLVKLVASVSACWRVLTTVHDELLAFRRRMAVSSLCCLGRYMYASSKSKYVSAAIVAGLTAVNTYVGSASRVARQHLGSIVEGDGETQHPRLVVLLLFEISRLTLSYVMEQTTNEFISMAAAQRREAVKAQMYEALSHTALTYFDSHTFDDIEEIMYYMDDMEGVDVRVHQYFFSSVSALLALQELRSLKPKALLLVCATAGLPHIIKFVCSTVRQQYEQLRDAGYLRWLGQCRSRDHGDDDDGFARDGTWMRGIEIIGAVHQLRPYGADVRLTHWWNYQTRHERADHFDGKHFLMDAFKVLVRLPAGKSVPGYGRALESLTKWLLPIALATHGASLCGLSESDMLCVAGSAEAVESTLDVLTETGEVCGMVLHNAYKARVLEQVMLPASFEHASHQERRYWKNYVTRNFTCAASDASVDTEEKPTGMSRQVSMIAPHGGAGGPAPEIHSVDLCDTTIYRCLTIHQIIFRNVRFRYAVTRTEDALAKPFSATLTLRERHAARGRFVCIEGPPGAGKSTLCALLLALYAAEGGTAAATEHGQAAPAIELVLGNRPPLSMSCSQMSIAPASPLAPRPNALANSNVQVHAALEDVPTDVLRGRLFSYVPQAPTLFHNATIAQNVSMHGYVSMTTDHVLQKVERCLMAAHCDFVQKLPQGVLTRVSNTGTGWSPANADGNSAAARRTLARLSADQAQRLMIARAFYHGGDVLLMDEPTTNVDPRLSEVLAKRWKELLRSGILKGVVCFTTDPVLLKHADEIHSL